MHDCRDYSATCTQRVILIFLASRFSTQRIRARLSPFEGRRVESLGTATCFRMDRSPDSRRSTCGYYRRAGEAADRLYAQCETQQFLVAGTAVYSFTQAKLEASSVLQRNSDILAVQQQLARHISQEHDSSWDHDTTKRSCDHKTSR